VFGYTTAISIVRTTAILLFLAHPNILKENTSVHIEKIRPKIKKILIAKLHTKLHLLSNISPNYIGYPLTKTRYFS
jgi:energy-converting hydrogenase Eha subunit H